MKIEAKIIREIAIGTKGLELKVRDSQMGTVGRLLIGNKRLSWLPKGHKTCPVKTITWVDLIGLMQNELQQS